MPDQHCPSRLVDVCDPLISQLQVVRHGAEHELQTASRMPQVRVLRHDVEELRRDRLAELESRALHDLFERAGGHDHDVVAAGTKRTSEADEWMDVAGGADGSHHELHKCKVESAK